MGRPRPSARAAAASPTHRWPSWTARAGRGFTGTLNGGDVEVWDLGPVAPGDRVVAEVDRVAGVGFDPAVALFDADYDLFATNDDINLQLGNLNARVDDYVREASDHFYLAVSISFFSSAGGAYQADARIIRGGAPPAPHAQKLMLWFAGGSNINIRNVGTFDIDPFDAADIDPAYAGNTDLIKTAIIDTIRQNYARFNVEIITSDDSALPAEGSDYSTLYFGQYSSTVFGISEQVDSWNHDACDDGIIYTDGFDDPFSMRPSATQIATAIGNVAAHEAGHLLGLSHVADVLDLMDTTGAANTLLADQEFKRAPLDHSIFRIGFQNGTKLLYDTVGAAP
ncbi:MAG: hypothetical protein U1A27_08490 [Phycisphaerae bacterium]